MAVDNCKNIGPLLSGLLDDELTQQDRQRVELHLEACPACRTTMEELARLRADVGALEAPQPTTEQWSTMMSAFTTKTSRALGWVYGIGGALVLTAYAIRQFAVDDTVPAIVKIGVLAVALGAGFLFLSVLLDRLAARRTDRYEDVER